MKLAEAASVLGISLEEVTTESLKQQYRRLIMSWDPDIVRDAQAKAKYSQITEAYKRLSSVMEGKDNFRPEDQQDVAAFMRIFMEMMGMSSEHDIPHAAAMTFSMMFGSHQNGTEEYSTDEDGDGSYYDDDEEEEEDEDYAGDEDEEDRSSAPCDNSWEPQAKVYSNMNLKNDIIQNHPDSETMLKKLKQAKKRAEKRKKQKERRNKEKENNEVSSKKLAMEEIDVEGASPELLEQLIAYHQNKARDQLIKSIDDGCSDSFEPLIMCSFQQTLSPIIADEIVSGFKAMLPSLNLFHRCITDFSEVRHLIENENSLPERLRTISQNRVTIAEKLFELTDPMLDFTSVDENGLSVLHHSIVLYDINYTNFVVRTITNGQNLSRKMSLNLNTRCQKKGWAPIHYAVEKANIPSIRLLAQAGANLQASSATDKRMVPIELAKARIKSSQSNAALKETAERVLSLLVELIAWQKNAAKEAEKQKKGDSGVDMSIKTPSKNSTNSNGTKSSSTPEKKEEKKEPASVTKTADKKKKGKNDGKKKEEVSSEAKQPKPNTKDVQPSTPASSTQHSSSGVTLNSGAIISLASHDEMVDNLLAMGFQESDCLQAIQLYGTDLDSAISWLCERPPVETKKRDEPTPPPPVNSRNSLVGMMKPLNPLPKKSSSSGDLSATGTTSTLTVPPTAPSTQPPASVTQPPAVPTRTTSKGWNIKEEDRKSKIDANHTPIIPMSEFVSLPPPSHTMKVAQKTPESSKKATGKNRANHSSSPTMANRLVTIPSSTVFSPSAHQRLPPAASAFPVFNGDQLSAQTQNLSASTESAFLPSFAPGLASTQGSMGLGFGNFSTDPLFDLSSGIGSFGSSFVTGSSLLDTMGSASSDHDLDYSIPAGGAIELSAGAKPFIPKSFTPIANPPSILSTAPSSQVIPSSTDFTFATTDASSSLVGSAFGASISSMDDPLRLLGPSTGSSLWSSTTVGLGIATSTGLGGLSSLGRQGDLPDYLSGILGGSSEHLDLGLDPNDMMPDLDSLLPTDF